MIEPTIYKMEGGFHAVIIEDSQHVFNGVGTTKEIAIDRCVRLYEKWKNKKGVDS